MNHLRNPGSIAAALGLIQSCIHNNEYEDAERYARRTMFIISDRTDNLISEDQRPPFLADGSYYLAQAIFRLTMAGGIPPEDKEIAGKEAIALARKALEIHTQLCGSESAQVASDMSILSDALDYFNNVDDDEVLRLMEQAIAIYSQVEGSSSVNVASRRSNLGSAHINRASRALDVNDLDRCVANLEQALTHFREAARIYQAIKRVDQADKILRNIAGIEEDIRQIETA